MILYPLHLMDQWLLDDYWRAEEAITRKMFWLRYNRMLIPMGVSNAHDHD